MAAIPPRTSVLLLALAVAALSCHAVEPPQQERKALQDFLAATPHERELGWNSPSAPSACLWPGVTCDARNVTVVAVRLPGVGLAGALPAGTLGELRGLHTLSLRNNRLFGAIPADFFALPQLRSLYLQGNRLSGAIPPDVAGLAALRHLALYDNHLSGEIPAALDGLRELRSLRLDRNRLSGAIPPDVAGLAALRHLALYDNHLSGEIPAALDGLRELRSLRLDRNRLSGGLQSLSGLRRLEVFNVSDNQLAGAVPASLASFPPESFAGNLRLCGEPLDRPCPSPGGGVVPPVQDKKRKRLSGAAIAAIALGAAAGALLAFILLVLCFVRRRRDDAAASGDDRNKAPTPATPVRGHTLTPSTVSGEMTDLTSSKEIPSAAGGGAAEMMRSRLVFMGGGGYSFDLEDLLRASAEVLGNGVAGPTYRATLEDGTTVAVKRLKNVAAERREFASAVEAVGRVQHRNLLPVRGYYYSSDEKLLVADFLPDGSLSAALHGSSGSSRTPMDWNTRKRAALSAARGMAHLHAAHDLTHGNLKSSNLLLRHGDPDAAALSDYSLQHLFSPPPSSVQGSVGGYRAPELVYARRPTFKSDVYSLGVLFLEILTGRPPTPVSTGVGDSGVSSDLPRWVQSVVREEWTAEVFDAELVSPDGGNDEEEMVALLQVAMACAATAPDARPDASEVVRMVEEIGTGPGRATTEDRVQGASEEEEQSWGTPTASATS